MDLASGRLSFQEVGSGMEGEGGRDGEKSERLLNRVELPDRGPKMLSECHTRPPTSIHSVKWDWDGWMDGLPRPSKRRARAGFQSRGTVSTSTPDPDPTPEMPSRVVLSHQTRRSWDGKLGPGQGKGGKKWGGGVCSRVVGRCMAAAMLEKPSQPSHQSRPGKAWCHQGNVSSPHSAGMYNFAGTQGDGGL